MTKFEQKVKSQYTKHLYISSIITIICAIFIGVFLFLQSYQDKVYYADRAKYDAEKSQWDSIQTIYIKKAEDSVFNYWVAHNDTSLKKIKKITKKLTYSPTGYHKKTDKLECELSNIKGINKYVCEPIKEWVTTGYYVDGHYYDTTWIGGYNNRDEWIKKARNIAHAEAIKHKVEFKPYDGHEFHYIIKTENYVLNSIFFISPFVALIGLVFFLITLFNLVFLNCKKRIWY